MNTITAVLSNGTTAHIVGRIDAFPGHPTAGTPVEPLTDDPNTHHDGPAFALVSVTWATQLTTVDLRTGTSRVQYVPGLLGSPTGTSWYLAPVTPTEHGYALTGRTAAGYHTATLPQLPNIDAPHQVKVHDFPI